MHVFPLRMAQAADMNYYEHHIGDYAAATAHLSLLEDAIYSRLLRRYYLQESPLPADEAQVARLAGARTPEEVAAVGVILAEFFVKQGDGWHSKRADEEIARYRVKIEAARENGKRGGRPPKETKRKPEITQPFNSGFDLETQPKALHTPDTSNTEAKASDAGASPEPPADPIWGTGLAFLIRKGIPEKQARSLIGRVKQACGDIEAGALLADCEAQDVTDPAPWLMAAASKRRARAGPTATPASKTLTAIETLQRMKSNGNLDSRRDSGWPEQAALLVAGTDASG